LSPRNPIPVPEGKKEGKKKLHPTTLLPVGETEKKGKATMKRRGKLNPEGEKVAKPTPSIRTQQLMMGERGRGGMREPLDGMRVPGIHIMVDDRYTPGEKDGRKQKKKKARPKTSSGECTPFPEE